MKSLSLSRLPLLMCGLLFWAMPLRAQENLCPDAEVLKGSLLEWILGKAPAVKSGTSSSSKITQALVSGNVKEAEMLIAQVTADSTVPIGSGLGAFKLTLGDLDGAWNAFMADTSKAPACEETELKYAAQYLQLYGTEAPLFPGFNGGFYHFLKDSLYGGEKLTLDQFDSALEALDLWFRLGGGKSPVAMELYADVLYRHPDRFIGNYFGALLYLRAASLCTGNAQKAYLEKSIYALEAPSEVSGRFDRYRFTQFQKAFNADLEATTLERNGEGVDLKAEASGILFFESKTGGQLAAILSKAFERHQKNTLYKPTNVDQVDARKVKQDTTFNMYALMMISVVIGAVIFFWVKIKRASR